MCEMILDDGDEGSDARGMFVPPDDDCLLKDASSQKIPRLTVKSREHCLSLLQDILHSKNTNSSDALYQAVEIEHEIFKACKSANLYKAAVLKRVSEMKKDVPSGSTEEKQTEAEEEPTPSSSSSHPEADLQGFTSASQVYSLKRKRVGAGFRGSSSLFQTAGDLLKNTQKETLEMSGDSVCEEEETGRKPKMKSSTSSPVKANSSTTSSLSSPSKKLSKKQQKLAEAAKDTRCISQYFGKKQTDSSQMKEDVSSELREKTPEIATSQDQTPSSSDINFITEKNSSADVSETAAAVMESPEEQIPKPVETEPEVSKDQDMKGENKSDDKQVQPKQLYKNRPQSPPAKRSRMLKEMKKVTFDPVVQESLFNTTNGHIADIKQPPVTLKEAADIVVRYLDPFYKKGKFANKDLFKSFARFLSHLLTEGKTAKPGQVKSEAKNLINGFFSRIERCESEMDWMHLKTDNR